MAHDNNNSGTPQATTADPPTTNGSAANGNGALSANGNPPPLNPFLEHHREELVRLSLQLLGSLGLKDSAKALEKETGIELQAPEVTSFRESVLAGAWDTVHTTLPNVALVDEHARGKVLYSIARQRYCELLCAGDAAAALRTLREEVAPHAAGATDLHALAALLACGDEAALSTRYPAWRGVHEGRRAVLQDIQPYISSAAMIEENRLCTLLKQGQEHQRGRCVYWNRVGGRHTLLSDFKSDPEHIPRHTNVVIADHSDEVWDLAFSHNGLMLATTSKDASIYIYDVEPFVLRREAPKLHCQLLSHADSVEGIRWSPDDKHLLSFSDDATLKTWDVKTGALLRTYDHHSDMILSACWCSDGEHFLSSGADRKLLKWHLNGRVVHRWDVPRVLDMCVSRDGEKLITVDSKNRITCYRTETVSKLAEEEGAGAGCEMPNQVRVDPTAPYMGLVRSSRCVMDEDAPMLWEAVDPDTNPVLWVLEERDYIASCELSKCGRYLVAGIHVRESRGCTHVYDLHTLKRMQKYTEPRQIKYVVRPVFGGAYHNFVLTGTEDGKILVMHRDTAQTLAALKGHVHTVNSVAWNPVHPDVIASCSDDRTVRLWSTTPTPEQVRVTTSGAAAGRRTRHNGDEEMAGAGDDDGDGDVDVETAVEDVGLAEDEERMEEDDGEEEEEETEAESD